MTTLYALALGSRPKPDETEFDPYQQELVTPLEMRRRNLERQWRGEQVQKLEERRKASVALLLVNRD